MSEVQKFLENHKVSRMEESKRLRLINAGMAEFAKGYNQASTDMIVKDAGISKGLLFHYFGTKEGFFLFLHKYAMKVVVEGVFQYSEMEERDVLERFWQLILLKRNMMVQYKSVFDFLKMTYVDDKDKIPAESRAEYDRVLQDSYGKLFTGIDDSLFREDIRLKDALNIISWTVQGMGAQEGAKYKGTQDYEEFLEEDMKRVRYYVDLLKKMLYK